MKYNIVFSFDCHKYTLFHHDTYQDDIEIEFATNNINIFHTDVWNTDLILKLVVKMIQKNYILDVLLDRTFSITCDEELYYENNIVLDYSGYISEFMATPTVILLLRQLIDAMVVCFSDGKNPNGQYPFQIDNNPSINSSVVIFIKAIVTITV